MPAGRPTDYKPEYAEQARKLCELGATDMELADFLDCDVSSVYRWKHSHPEFCEAIKNGKDIADERVERSLYHKAIGYSVTEQQAFKLKCGDGSEKVELVDVQAHIAADTTAGIFWLKNRRSGTWRDKVDHEHGVTSELAGILERVDGRTRVIEPLRLVG